MKKKLTVSIEHILEMQKERQAINKCSLDKIEFTLNGKVVDISKKIIDDWRFVGLNNTDFIVYGFYKRKRTLWKQDKGGL